MRGSIASAIMRDAAKVCFLSGLLQHESVRSTLLFIGNIVPYNVKPSGDRTASERNRVADALFAGRFLEENRLQQKRGLSPRHIRCI